MKVTWLRILLVIGIMVINIGCDQYTKQVAKESLSFGERHDYLFDTFSLTYAENDGAFLSLGTNFPKVLQHWLLKVFPVVLLVGLFLYTLFSKQLDRWSVIAFSFILGGGISNIYDRLLYEYVVDFMVMGVGQLRTGIFNFADVAIMTGLFMMLPVMIKSGKSKKEEPAEEEQPTEDTTDT